MSSDQESRKLSDMRVVDLRNELEKRGLDRSGNKHVLLERLQKALNVDDGDTESSLFELEKKPAKRLSTSSNQHENDRTPKEKVNIDNSESTSDNPATEQPKERKIEKVAKVPCVEKGNGVAVSLHQSRKVAEDSGGDSFLRLTLDEEEGLQEEVEGVSEEKEIVEEKRANEDKKSTTNKKPQEELPKVIPVNSDNKKPNMKKQEGNSTSVGASSNKTSPRIKKMNVHQNRNLWITNISQTTRATELKQALSSYGKVIGAKVVINAKYPGACCYGYVTMDTVEDADNCILKLNNTELSGQIIRIEKVRPDHMNAVKFNAKLKPKTIESPKDEKIRLKSSSRSLISKGAEKKESIKDSDKRDDRSSEHKSDTLLDKRKDINRKSRSNDRKVHSGERRRSDSRGSRPRPREGKDILTFNKIKEEHERHRMRERERVIREESRRRREEAVRQREVERMQRSEAARLDREREKLRVEREKLEREKAEIIRLERERQKLEREKLELERLELQRVKIRLQEENRRTSVKRPAPYRREGSYEDRKRIAGDRHYEESPPSPRFEPSNVKPREPTPQSKKFGATKDYKARINFDKRESYGIKRDREFETTRSHPQSSATRGLPTTITKYEGSSIFNISRERDMRDPRTRENPPVVINTRAGKDGRYNERERERSPHFRPLRDDRDRRTIPEHKSEIRPVRDHRFGDTNKGFDRNTSGNNWNHPNSVSNKMFNSGPPPKTWGKDSWRLQDGSNTSHNTSQRWNSNNAPRSSLSTGVFSGNSNLNMASCPPPPAINNYGSDRFEYKSMGNVRKY